MKLPVVSGSDAVKAFRNVGYEFDEQSSDSSGRGIGGEIDPWVEFRMVLILCLGIQVRVCPTYPCEESTC